MKIVDRAWMTTSTVGTGSLTLVTNVPGYQTFANAGLVNTDVVDYTIIDGAAWETGYGVVGASSLALTRVIDASSTGSPLSLSGNATVFTTIRAKSFVTPASLRGFIGGLEIAPSGGSVNISILAGSACSDDQTAMMVLTSTMTKTTSGWAVGTTNGGIDTGAIANNTWYHVWLIRRPDTGVVDVLLSLSATAPTLPSNYTQKRRIGAAKTGVGVSTWVTYYQNGDEFLWRICIQDINTSTLTTSAALFALASVPLGLQFEARLRGSISNAAAGVSVLVSGPDELDQAPNTPGGNYTVNTAVAAAAIASTPFSVRTDTSAQVRMRASAASTTVLLNTYGWLDRRGQDD